MTVCRVLRENLAASREQDLPFARAWSIALDRALLDVEDRCERSAWKDVLTAQVDIWRSAYERAPSKVPSVVSVLAEHGDRVPCGERQCARCDGDIPPERPAFARYCSRDCYEEAALERDWQGSRDRARRSRQRRLATAA